MSKSGRIFLSICPKASIQPQGSVILVVSFLFVYLHTALFGRGRWRWLIPTWWWKQHLIVSTEQCLCYPAMARCLNCPEEYTQFLLTWGLLCLGAEGGFLAHQNHSPDSSILPTFCPVHWPRVKFRLEPDPHLPSVRCSPHSGLTPEHTLSIFQGLFFKLMAPSQSFMIPTTSWSLAVL